MLGRTGFVIWLFVMATACAGIAIGDRSWGWFVGAIVFSVLGYVALRLYKSEHETGTGRQGISLGFAGIAMLLAIVVMLGLFWLQFKA